MAIANYHFAPGPGETNTSPAGGCWVQGDGTYEGDLPGFLATDPAGSTPLTANRPATFYPSGYWLPAGTTTIAKMFSSTTHGRIIEYVPWQYTSSTIRNLLAIRAANAERVPQLLAEGLLQPGEVDEYIANRGLTAQQLRVLSRADEYVLRAGEKFIGRPVIVLFQVGTPARVREQMVRKLWQDIQDAMEGYL